MYGEMERPTARHSSAKHWVAALLRWIQEKKLYEMRKKKLKQAKGRSATRDNKENTSLLQDVGRHDMLAF